MRSTAELRADALAIWHAAVAAVRSDRLVIDRVRVERDALIVGDESHALPSVGKIAVVGAGKAGAGMAAGLAAALGDRILADKHVHGWLNVPADCVPKVVGTGAPAQRVGVPSSESESSTLKDWHASNQLESNGTRSVTTTIDGARSVPATIHLHPARPAGLNEPTTEGVVGAQKILEIVLALGPNDLCFCLISGGGSALLPAPVAGVSLAEKQAITRLLSSGGANIQELNTVRKHLSRIKGGGLARACRAGRLITLLISDVLGDPQGVIASGPTVPDTSTPVEALSILERFAQGNASIAPAAFAYLRQRAAAKTSAAPPTCAVTNVVIGNNAVAVAAAAKEAESRGYSPAIHSATTLEGSAEDVGIDLARAALRMQSQPGPDCLITGGEPTVKLAPPELRGKGGRNQQLVLAALVELISDSRFSILGSQQGNPKSQIPNPKFCLLSGGTDGEDGPTDAAGAFLDAQIISRLRASHLDPADFLRRNDAYQFFQLLGGLIHTGPTHTNVCDVRVVVVDRTS